MDTSLKVVVLIVVALVARGLYNDYVQAGARHERKEHSDIVRQYLVTQDDRPQEMTGRPILWIHVDHEYNARDWSSFYSRSNTKVNQPYIMITMKSIIDKCIGSFDICIIDDKSFENLVPGWKINMAFTPEPSRTTYRQLGMSTVLYEYGGLLVPASFLCFRDLKCVYDICDTHQAVSTETVNRCGLTEAGGFCPSPEFMGCKKGAEVMKNFVEYQSALSTETPTAAPVFMNSLGAWLSKQTGSSALALIDGKRIGTRKVDDRPVDLSELMSINTIDFQKGMLGIYLPHKDILSRTEYGWFTRMSADQVLSSNLSIAQYMLASY